MLKCNFGLGLLLTTTTTTTTMKTTVIPDEKWPANSVKKTTRSGNCPAASIVDKDIGLY